MMAFSTATLLSGFSAANDGTILAADLSDTYRLSWLDRDGKVLNTLPRPDHYTGLQISPDGAQAVLSVAGPLGVRDISTLDLARGVQTRVASGNAALSALWSPDGRVIACYAALGNAIFERDAGGTGTQRTLVESPHLVRADDYSRDGSSLLYDQLEDDGSATLWLTPRSPSADRKPVLYTKVQGPVSAAQFSPDGKWVAYSSVASGKYEIYVQSFPNADSKMQISNNGGTFPRWRRDGKELFYRAGDGRLMAASVRATAHGLDFGAPIALFRVTEPIGVRFYPYDVSSDGQRILAMMPDSSERVPLRVLINWQAGLRK
jgi:Tol biopolymer transport system component